VDYDDPRYLAQVLERTKEWSPQRRSQFLAHLRSETARRRLIDLYAHPAQIAAAIDPHYLVTPAIELISREVEETLRTPGRNLLVTMSPQEGKSQLCSVWTPIRAFQLDRSTRVMLVTYADALAEEHSHTARDVLLRHGSGVHDQITDTPVPDQLGLSVRPGRAATSRWRLREGKGGLVAVGVGSSITGRSADLLIIDDPYKNRQEADSAAHRAKIDAWFRSVALTRLSPGANVILIQTRWHPEDLAGTILSEEAELPEELRTWRYINIPAVSREGVPDALGREPGETMLSARGRTSEQWAQIRRNVGERVWFAMYEGMPTPPDGGLFARKWFDDHRVERDVEHPVARIVAVDPAETGEGDEAGIVAGALCSDTTILLTHDRSGRMTSDEWGRAAVELALEIGAREIAVEAYSAPLTYARVVRDSYRAIRRDAVAARMRGDQLTPAEVAALRTEQQPFTIYSWRGKGDAIARSALLRQGVETGTTRVVASSCALMEEQAATWQQGQHQPDRVAAALIAHARLLALAGGVTTLAAPLGRGAARGTGAAWMRRRLG
jgi:hypothetical protein